MKKCQLLVKIPGQGGYGLAAAGRGGRAAEDPRKITRRGRGAVRPGEGLRRRSGAVARHRGPKVRRVSDQDGVPSRSAPRPACCHGLWDQSAGASFLFFFFLGTGPAHSGLTEGPGYRALWEGGPPLQFSADPGKRQQPSSALTKRDRARGEPDWWITSARQRQPTEPAAGPKLWEKISRPSFAR